MGIMIRTEVIRLLVLELDEKGQSPEEIARNLGVVSVARVDRILDEQDAAQGVPHPHRDRAPVLEPLGGPAVINSQAAVAGGSRDAVKEALTKQGPKRQAVAKPKPPRRPLKVIECGTTAGYDKHRREGTPKCDPCKAAWLEYDQKLRPRKPPRPPIVCGTPAGRGKHLRAGEPVCEPCRLAFNAHRRDQWAINKGIYVSSYREIEHGTGAGFQAHKRRGEAPCEDCRVAKNLAKLKPITHGTRNGYVQHRRRNEEPCQECLAANAEASKQSKRKRKAS